MRGLTAQDLALAKGWKLRALNELAFQLSVPDDYPAYMRDSAHKIASLVDGKKDEGNERFRSGDFYSAMLSYVQAGIWDYYRSDVWCNRSAACLRAEVDDCTRKALLDANAALYVRPDWGKAYLRRGEALRELGRLPEAAAALRKAIALEPEAAAYQSILKGIEAKLPRRSAIASADATSDELFFSHLEQTSLLQLNVDEVPGRGRCLITRRDFPTNSVLFVVAPLVAAPRHATTVALLICDHCLRALDEEVAIKCDGCDACYCTDKCRMFAWLKFHATLCPYVQPAFNVMLEGDPSLAMPLRILAMMAQDARRGDTCGIWPHISRMVSATLEEMTASLHWSGHPSTTQEEVLAAFEVRASSIQDALGRSGIPAVDAMVASFDAAFLCRVWGICHRNAIAFEPRDAHSECWCIMPLLTYANHDCDPNIVYEGLQGEGAYMLVQTLRPVAAGEELCVKYIEVDGMTVEGRRTELRMRYGFVCSCKRCCSEAEASEHGGTATEATAEHAEAATVGGDELAGTGESSEVVAPATSRERVSDTPGDGDAEHHKTLEDQGEGAHEDGQSEPSGVAIDSGERAQPVAKASRGRRGRRKGRSEEVFQPARQQP